MKVWQSDLLRFSSADEADNQWLLLICNEEGSLIYEAKCPQSQVNGEWLTNCLKQAIETERPDKIQIFRPQIVGLFSIATEQLNISLETTRRTPAIKEKVAPYIHKNKSVISSNSYLGIDRPPPQNLPENIWGENWSFVSIDAGEITNFIENRPIRFCNLPPDLLTTNANLDSEIKVPGIVIYGGRKSLKIAQWLDEEKPVSLNYIPTEIGKSGGLVLESGLVDRWIVATFESKAVAEAAQAYEAAKQQSDGLHFLLLQPDDSGMTHTGFWFLQDLALVI